MFFLDFFESELARFGACVWKKTDDRGGWRVVVHTTSLSPGTFSYDESFVN